MSIMDAKDALNPDGMDVDYISLTFNHEGDEEEVEPLGEGGLH